MTSSVLLTVVRQDTLSDDSQPGGLPGLYICWGHRPLSRPEKSLPENVSGFPPTGLPSEDRVRQKSSSIIRKVVQNQ